MACARAALTRQEEDLVVEKRRRIEEQLWAIHEADIGDCFETYEAAKVGKNGKLETDGDGKMLTVRKQRPRLLSDLPPDLRKAIEHVPGLADLPRRAPGEDAPAT